MLDFDALSAGEGEQENTPPDDAGSDADLVDGSVDQIDDARSDDAAIKDIVSDIVHESDGDASKDVLVDLAHEDDAIVVDAAAEDTSHDVTTEPDVVASTDALDSADTEVVVDGDAAEEAVDAPDDLSVADATDEEGGDAMTESTDEDTPDAVADVFVDTADDGDGDGGDAVDALADVATDPVEEDVVAEDVVSEPIAVGCASGTCDFDYGTNMQLCGGANPQCSADALCAAGWHLCTYSEFVSRGGALVDPPSTQMYWIAGSLRDNCGDFTVPMDRIVLQCTTEQSLNQEFVTWDCATDSPIERSNYCNLGLAIGVNRWKLQGQVLCVPLTPQAATHVFGAACCQ